MTVDARPVRPDGAAPLVRAQLTVQVVDSAVDAEALVPEWRELAAVAGTTPFTGPDYGLTWWRHRGRGRLHLVTVRSAGRLVALAPLHVRPIAGLRVVRFLGHGLGTVAELLVRPGYGAAATAVWAHLATDRRILLELVEYRDDGAGLAELRRSAYLHTSATLRDVCPVIELDGVAAAGDLLDRLHRRHPMRRSVERGERRMAESDRTLSVDVAEDVDALRALLPAVTEIFDEAETHRPRLHLLRPPWQAFLVELLETLTARRQATLFLARIDGAPAGFEITVDDDTTVHHWLSRFRPAAAEFSVGHLLMRSIVDRAIASGRRRCDLLIGDGPHKLPWAGASYDTLTVHAAPDTLAARRAALAGVLFAGEGVRAGLARARRVRA